MPAGYRDYCGFCISALVEVCTVQNLKWDSYVSSLTTACQPREREGRSFFVISAEQGWLGWTQHFREGQCTLSKWAWRASPASSLCWDLHYLTAAPTSCWEGLWLPSVSFCVNGVLSSGPWQVATLAPWQKEPGL